MKRILVGLCALATVTLSYSRPVQPPDTHDADVEALRATEAQWNDDFRAKDIEKLVAHYADHAVLISPGSSASNGEEAIRSTLKEMVGDSALSLKFEARHIDVAKSGDMAYTTGSYTLTMTDPGTKQPINDKGSYVTVYRKQLDGSWKAVADIASSETPPGPALPKK